MRVRVVHLVQGQHRGVELHPERRDHSGDRDRQQLEAVHELEGPVERELQRLSAFLLGALGELA